MSFLGGIAQTYFNEKRIKKELDLKEKIIMYSMATKIANIAGLLIILLIALVLFYFEELNLYIALIILFFFILTVYSTISCYSFKVLYNEDELTLYSIFKKEQSFKYKNINNYKFSEFKQQHILGTDCCGNINLSLKLKGLINFWIEFQKHEHEFSEKLRAQIKFGNSEN